MLAAWHGPLIPRANNRESWGGGVRTSVTAMLSRKTLPWATGEGRGEKVQEQGANIHPGSSTPLARSSSAGPGMGLATRQMEPSLVGQDLGDFIYRVLGSAAGAFTAKAWGWATTHSVKNQNRPKAPVSESEVGWAALIGLPRLTPAVRSARCPTQSWTSLMPCSLLLSDPQLMASPCLPGL